MKRIIRTQAQKHGRTHTHTQGLIGQAEAANQQQRMKSNRRISTVFKFNVYFNPP